MLGPTSTPTSSILWQVLQFLRKTSLPLRALAFNSNTAWYCTKALARSAGMAEASSFWARALIAGSRLAKSRLERSVSNSVGLTLPAAIHPTAG